MYMANNFRDKIKGLFWDNEPRDITPKQNTAVTAAQTWAQALSQWPQAGVPVQWAPTTWAVSTWAVAPVQGSNAMLEVAQNINQPSTGWIFDKIEAVVPESTTGEVAQQELDKYWLPKVYAKTAEPLVVAPKKNIDITAIEPPALWAWAISNEIVPMTQIPWQDIEAELGAQEKFWALKKDIIDIKEMFDNVWEWLYRWATGILNYFGEERKEIRKERKKIKAQTKLERQEVGTQRWDLFTDQWISLSNILMDDANAWLVQIKNRWVKYNWNVLDIKKINKLEWYVMDDIYRTNEQLERDSNKFSEITEKYNIVQNSDLPDEQMAMITQDYEKQIGEMQTSMNNTINNNLWKTLRKTFTYDEYVKFLSWVGAINNVKDTYETKKIALQATIDEKLNALKNTPASTVVEEEKQVEDSTINKYFTPIAQKAQQSIYEWKLPISSNILMERMWEISRWLQEYQQKWATSLKTTKEAIQSSFDRWFTTKEEYDWMMNFVNTDLADYIKKTDTARVAYFSYVAEYQLDHTENEFYMFRDAQNYANEKFKQNDISSGLSYTDYVRSVEPKEYNFWYKKVEPFFVPWALQKSDKDWVLSMVGAVESELWNQRWGLIWMSQWVTSFVKKLTNSYLSPWFRTLTNSLGWEANPAWALDQMKLLNPINFTKWGTPWLQKTINNWADIDDNVALTLGTFFLFRKVPALSEWMWDLVWKQLATAWMWFKTTRHISNAVRFMIEAGPVNWTAWGLISAGMNEIYNEWMVKTDLYLGMLAEWFQSIRKRGELTKKWGIFDMYDHLKDNETRRKLLYSDGQAPTEQDVAYVANIARNAINDLRVLWLTDPDLVQQTVKIMAAQWEMKTMLAYEFRNKLKQIGSLPNIEWKSITEILDSITMWEFKMVPTKPTDPILWKLRDNINTTKAALVQNPNMPWWDIQQSLWINWSMLNDDQKKYVQWLIYEVTDKSEDATTFLSKWYNNVYKLSTLWDWESSVKTVLKTMLQRQKAVKRWVLKYWLTERPSYIWREVVNSLKKLETDAVFMDDIRAKWIWMNELFTKVEWYSDVFKISDEWKKVFTQITKWDVASQVADIPQKQAIEIADSLGTMSKDDQAAEFFKWLREAWMKDEIVNKMERSNVHANINKILDYTSIDLAC